MTVRIGYIGNFEPRYSTENDILDTLLMMETDVVALQEGDPTSWLRLVANPSEFDMILWTSTRSLAELIDPGLQREMLYRAHLAGVPTVGFHLDRWWGLDRWRTVLEAPFFSCEYVYTADGSHARHFRAAGGTHLWSPPAIAPRSVGLGIPRDEYKTEIAFVGMWQHGYHREWAHRYEMLTWLQHNYRGRVEFFPRRGEPAVRGDDLRDLYASAKVVIGDSCLVPTVDGEPMHHYCSDRVFETIGRGGYLIHPHVVGVTDGYPLTPGQHLATWPLWDWGALKAEIDLALLDEEMRDRVRLTGYRYVATKHTYLNRMDKVLNDVLPGSEWRVPTIRLADVEMPVQVEADP